ncbi:MAG: lipoprotein insertase outer membrane protein LolB [Lysobacterales bacterium]
MRRFYWLCLLLPVLNACTGVGVKQPGVENRPAYQERAGLLSVVEEWGLVGKISLDDGDQGGSGKLRWDVKPDHSELDFHGAMGRGAWHLQTGPQGALLKMADGTEQRAESVNELIQDNIGWPVPLDALHWWVRGLAAPGFADNEEIGAYGLLVSLLQFGWNVSFTRYDSFEGMELPVRLNATRDDYRVKLAIQRWRMDQGDDPVN